LLADEPGHPGDGEPFPGSGTLWGSVGGNPPGDVSDGAGILGRSLWGIPTPSSLGSTGSVDAGPQPVSDGKGSPITFAHGWEIEDQENVRPGSAVGGLILIQDEAGEIDQGIERIMEEKKGRQPNGCG
jgi:hypothetical protein